MTYEQIEGRVASFLLNILNKLVPFINWLNKIIAKVIE